MVASVVMSGCLGPKAVQYTRLRYNEAYRDTNDEQLLINIVRLRYADSPVFIDLPSITSQFEVSGGSSYASPNQAVSSAFGYGGFEGRDTPTLSYHPREGREIAKALLNPLSSDLLIVFNTGANIHQFLWMALNDMNDVQNAPQATTMVPMVPGDNTEYLRGIQMLSILRDHGGVELSIGIVEESEGASDPIPTGQLKGTDLLDAAKGGYVYRARGFDQVALLKRERELVLRLRPQFVHSPEAFEMARVFHLTPGLSRYKLKSELAEEAYSTPTTPINGDTIYLNMRSVLQVMIFMSKGVCVPLEHIETGIAPTTPGPDGRPYDWTRVTAGHFFVAAQKHKPRDAEVAVPYRGYWFFIPKSDVNSRAILAILELLFSLQESDSKTGGPLLTLPLGG